MFKKVVPPVSEPPKTPRYSISVSVSVTDNEALNVLNSHSIRSYYPISLTVNAAADDFYEVSQFLDKVRGLIG